VTKLATTKLADAISFMWCSLATFWFRHFSTRHLCIFCGYTDSPLTKEHVIPQWVSKLRGKHKATTVFRINSEIATPRRFYMEIGIDSQASIVCARCNNGPLSTFETKQAKPIISKLLPPAACLGKTILGSRQQTVLAAWMFRVVAVLEFIYPTRRVRFFSQSQREIFSKTLIPPKGIWIWMAHYTGPDDYTFTLSDQNAFPYLPFIGKGLHATISVGHIALQLVALGPLQVPIIPSAWSDAVIQLFPYTGQDVIWPPPISLDDDGFWEFRNRWRR